MVAAHRFLDSDYLFGSQLKTKPATIIRFPAGFLFLLSLYNIKY